MTDRSTQCDLVLRRLQQGPATVRDFMDLGISRFGARIWELRKQGYKIESSETRVRGQRHVTYYLTGKGCAASPTSLTMPSLPPSVDSAALQRLTVTNEAICAYPPCAVAFKPRQKNQRYHSTACRFADWDRQHPRLNFSESAHNRSTGNPQPCELQGGDL